MAFAMFYPRCAEKYLWSLPRGKNVLENRFYQYTFIAKAHHQKFGEINFASVSFVLGRLFAFQWLLGMLVISQ